MNKILTLLFCAILSATSLADIEYDSTRKIIEQTRLSAGWRLSYFHHTVSNVIATAAQNETNEMKRIKLSIRMTNAKIDVINIKMEYCYKSIPYSIGKTKNAKEVLKHLKLLNKYLENEEVKLVKLSKMKDKRHPESEKIKALETEIVNDWETTMHPLSEKIRSGKFVLPEK